MNVLRARPFVRHLSCSYLRLGSEEKRGVTPLVTPADREPYLKPAPLSDLRAKLSKLNDNSKVQVSLDPQSTVSSSDLPLYGSRKWFEKWKCYNFDCPFKKELKSRSKKFSNQIGSNWFKLFKVFFAWLIFLIVWKIVFFSTPVNFFMDYTIIHHAFGEHRARISQI